MMDKTSQTRSRTTLIWIFAAYFALPISGFRPTLMRNGRRLTTARQRCNAQRYFLLSDRLLLTKCLETSSPLSEAAEKPCFWRPKPRGSRWVERIHIKDLQVGQKLTGHVVDELLVGKTGPKVFFECGVGRTKSAGDWQIVNGMMRLDRSKVSVTTKRVSRLRKKDAIELYVSRVQIGCGRFEVCSSPEDVVKYQREVPMVSVSSLEVNQEVVGTVVKLLSYGAMIDVGANRLGLLHIKRVADLYGRYIDKEKGLEKAGLERGTKVRLLVESIDKKRLSLDFTIDVKSDGMEEQSQDSSQSSEASTKSSVSNGEHATSVAAAMSAEELAEWAAIASEGEDSQETVAEKDEDEMEDEDDDYDDYDEERDIEDALGLGYY